MCNRGEFELEDGLSGYWAVDEESLLSSLDTTRNGLSSNEASQRQQEYGPNRIGKKTQGGFFSALVAQFKSPIIIILLFSALLAFAASDNIDGLIIIAIVVSSSLLGFWQERMASNAIAKLLSMVEVKATVLRDNHRTDILVEDIVPGDIVFLSAGDIIPADSRILESHDLFINEATLTGETYPSEKQVGSIDLASPLGKRTNSVFMGTDVASGSCVALVVRTGKNTEFGKIAQKLSMKPPETDFEVGIRRFGYLLMQMTLLFMIAIFAFNVFFERPVLDSFLFALALAVGITPQLLPTIVSVNLSKGAQQMAKFKVIVKKLDAIEDFGSMNILCTDKTGTITEGVMRIHAGVDTQGTESNTVLEYAFLNASFQTGYKNPIDQAILKQLQFESSGYVKVDELPYDFIRKRLSVLLQENDQYLLVMKGAVGKVLECCTRVQNGQGDATDIREQYDAIMNEFKDLSGQGYRIIAVAYKKLRSPEVLTKKTETKLVLLGFLLMIDPPKEHIADTLAELRELGVQVKIVTGDNELVAAQIGRQIGIESPRVLTGSEIRQTADDALGIRANEVDIFAEVEPNQKERIIRALRKSGNVVGFMGDGINDASALHAADVGISVDSAADVAKEAAQFVLLEKDLNVLVDGVKSGRKTFANTIKYIMITMSANFGNMFSMAGASLLLPFLPLLPKQILGINFLSDFPGMTIASDGVDSDLIVKPRRWNLGFINRFMIVFGLLSTIFDFISFGVLLYIGSGQPDIFRTGWFVVSVITELLVMLIIRTRRPFYRSRPSRPLFISSVVVVGFTLILPYSFIGGIMSLVPLSMTVMAALVGIAVAYLLLNETAKAVFYHKVQL
jgi:Mg2+-importing ATPase